MEITVFKDAIYLASVLVTIAGSYFAIKYQGALNARDIKKTEEANTAQWSKIDSLSCDINTIKERMTLAISMETAEKKFVTKELFELRMRQFDIDLQQTKNISQSTLDGVQTLHTQLNQLANRHQV